MKKRFTWTIIGGGNGGQSLAGHLGLMGFAVRIYDIFPATIAAIQDQAGITVDGAVEGFGPVELATTHLDQAVAGADIVMVVTPATAHRSLAAECASLLADGQVLFIHPGATGGALEFIKILKQQGCTADITLAESNSLLYACRSSAPGRASIFGIKKQLRVAALPASRNTRVLAMLNTAFPQMSAARNVLETGLDNPNAMMHPAPTLLNTSQIESGRDWLYYWDGITASIGAFVEAMDKERLALGAAFGLQLTPILQFYRQAYGVRADTLSEAVKLNPAYEKVHGQKDLRTRYLLEDIPTGLVPMVSLGRALAVDVGRMETIIKLGEYILGEDLMTTGRTLEQLGLAGMTVPEILHFLETGRSG